jgi:hypothetical protein
MVYTTTTGVRLGFLIIAGICSPLKFFIMKKLKFFIPLLAILMALTACQKENIVEDQTQNQEVFKLKKHPVPFHAEYISTVLSTNPNPEVCDGMGAPVFNLQSTLEGTATHMGNIIGSISSCIDPTTNPATIFNGEVVFEAANGDLLYIFGGSNPLEINGGTGRFENATGWVNSTFELIGTNPLTFSETMDGEIQY